MDHTVSVILFIAIGFILAMFSSKVYDFSYDRKKLNDMCNNRDDEISNYNSESNKKCRDAKRQITERYDKKKFINMMSLGFVYILAGVLLSKWAVNPTFNGVSLGGLFLILWYVFTNWNTIDDKQKLLIMGSGLAGLSFVGYKSYTQH